MRQTRCVPVPGPAPRPTCHADGARDIGPQAWPRSDLNHLEVFLARAALGTGPIDRDILPARARCNTFFWQSGFFVVDPAADQAHPASIFHSYAASKSLKITGKTGAMMVPFFTVPGETGAVAHKRG
ncbi:protein of unknown function [Paraburkholderia kururiensis]